MKIVAFAHRRRVGKDQACTFMNSHLRVNGSKLHIIKASFAYELKYQTYLAFGWAGIETPEFYDKNPEKKEEILPELGISPRDLWIKYANDLRAIHPYIWINLLFHKHKDCDLLLISDCRYPNEVKHIHSLGGKVIKIHREGEKEFDDEADSALADWTDWDKVIENDSTLSNFYKKIANLCEEYEDGYFQD
jgi:hypothetical protein